jgi:hypothetical protein
MTSMTNVSGTSLPAALAQRWGFHRMASVDNPKASKATAYGYLNAILYMAPADSAGVGNLCPHAGTCAALCLGEHSGQAAIGAAEKNATIAARKARARAYMTDRDAFLREVAKDVARLMRLAAAAGRKLVYRFNGSTDVGVPAWLCDLFPEVTFIDYTKNPNRMAAYLAGRLPPNYFLTFSRDTHNERLATRFLAQGGNVAVVFGSARPAAWNGFPTVDGDRHDIRTPAEDGRGVVVALTPKGRKAKADRSGFVIQEYAA